MSTRDNIKLKYPIPCVNCSDVKGFYNNYKTCSIINEIDVRLEDAMVDYFFPGIVDDVISDRYSHLIKRSKNWKEEGFFSCGTCKQDYNSIVKLRKDGLYIMDSIKFYRDGENRLKNLIHSFENSWVSYKLYSNGGLLENKCNEETYPELIRNCQEKAKNYCSSIECNDIKRIIEGEINELCFDVDVYDSSYVNMVLSYNLQRKVTNVVKDGLRADLILLNGKDSDEAKKKALLLDINSFDLDVKCSKWFFEKDKDFMFGMLSGPNMILRRLKE